MSARILRRFFGLAAGAASGRCFSRRATNSHRDCAVVSAARVSVGTGPARPDPLHPATADSEVAAAPAERVVAGCASSAASTRRRNMSLLRRQAAEIWGAATVAPDMALVRALARLASKRKMEPTEGQTSPRRGERRASSTARAFAAAAAPRSTRRPSSAGAHLAGSPAGGGAKSACPARRRSPRRSNQRIPAGRRASSPLPVARGGADIREWRGGGTMSAPALRRPARPASRLPRAARTPRTHGDLTWAAAAVGGGGSPCARLPDGGERPASIAPRHGAAGETRRKDTNE